MESKLESQNTINERIKILLKKLGLNQKEFCNQSKIDTSVFSRVLRGAAMPRYDLLYKVYTAVEGVNANWFLTGDGNAFGEGGVSMRQPQPFELELAQCKRENELLEQIVETQKTTIQALSR